MISFDVIEYKRYSFSDLFYKFKCDEKQTFEFLKYLKEYGIVKSVKNSQNQKDLSDLVDDDYEIGDVDKKDCLYVFVYVGIIIISDYIIKCFPKYFIDSEKSEKDLRQVIQVIKKYNSSKKQVISIQNEINDKNEHNLLSIILYLLDDYFKNGLYGNTINIVEYNGDGEILWDKTINETYALIQNNQPYYVDLYTKNNKYDNKDYFKLLHEVILTECSEKLKKVKLWDLFDVPSVNLNYEDINNFGDKDYILYRINKELEIQYNFHKQTILKAMYIYIKQSNSYLGGRNYFDLFGTNSYNLVWEKICGSVLNNIIKEPLINLELPDETISRYKDNDKLLTIIEKPVWYMLNNIEEGEKTLIPDSIVFNRTLENFEFIIFDAKYYKWPLKRKPGIGDIVKQYLYELAYKDFIKENGFTSIKNCFLFPSSGNKIENMGYVELTMLKKMGLRNIQILLLPAKLVNELYLKDEQLDVSNLELY